MGTGRLIRLRLPLALGAVLALATPAHAVTYAFTTAPSNLFGVCGISPLLVAGEGTFSYQPGPSGTPATLTFDLCTWSISTVGANHVAVAGNFPGVGDFFGIDGFGGTTQDPFVASLYFFNLVLEDPSGTALDAASLPAALDLADWAVRFIRLQGSTQVCSPDYGCEEYPFSIGVLLTSFTLIPEPSTLLLTALGVVALVAARRATL